MVKPRRASRIFVADVNPACASSAAVTPFSAARPACKGFVIVPKFSRKPDAMLAAIPKVELTSLL
jgi:hypothetical protein